MSFANLLQFGDFVPPICFMYVSAVALSVNTLMCLSCSLEQKLFSENKIANISKLLM